MSSGIATVKAVKSGDCVVLMGKAAAGKRPEIELTLSSLIAPHMGNRSRDEEEFGNASREFLRNLVIGKRVAFKVDYKVDAIRRTFGAIDLDGVGDVGTAIVRNGWANVRPSRDGDDQCAANIDELMGLAEAAKAGGIGMFNKKAKASKKKWNIAQNERLDEKAATALLKELKKSPQEIIIEHVLDGAAVRATLVSREPKVSMVIAFSGIVCPRVRPMAPRKRGPKPADGEAAAAPKSAPLDPEPFALEARDFTEVRLLHRRLEVLFEGVGRNGKFYGTVVHKKGNIGVKLVEVGLAKVQEWTLIFASKAAQQAARAGQNDAKKKKKHLWANYVAPAMPKPFRGTVVDVVNTDTIVVQPSGGGEERRVALASIRAPWLGRRDERPKPWAYECAELLRKSCIGKQVEVTIDYTRGADPTRPPKEFGTVTLKSGRGNVAVAIAAAGLAEAERHRAGEEAAYAYPQILEAEQRAKKAGLGVHGEKTPIVYAPTDLLGMGAKSRVLSYIPALTAKATVSAVVQHCFSASSMKVYIPSQDIILSFALAAVRTGRRKKREDRPRPDAAAKEGAAAAEGAEGAAAPPAAPARRYVDLDLDAYGQEAWEFTRKHLHMRDVDLEVAGVDGRGMCTGSVFVPINGIRTNISVALLQRGLGKMVARGEVQHYEDMDNAQYSARSAEIKIWTDYQAKREEIDAANEGAFSRDAGREGGDDAGGAEETGSRGGGPGKSVKLSDMQDGTSFHVHVVVDGVCADLETISEQMASLGASIDAGTFVDPMETKSAPAAAAPAEATSGDAEKETEEETEEASAEPDAAGASPPGLAAPTMVPVKKGSYVAAPFDGAWYRAKVLATEGERAEVQFVDYGNIDVVEISRLHLLPSTHTKASPQAIACTLAFVTVPALGAAYGQEAAAKMSGLLWGKELVAKMHGRDESGRTNVEISASSTDGEESLSVNEQMLRAGLARLPAQRRSGGRGGRGGGRSGGSSSKGGPSAALQAAQEYATSNHLNIFRYGVAMGDEDEVCKEWGMPKKESAVRS